MMAESRRALRELIDLLTELDERFAGPEWMVESADDVAGAHRAVMHLLQGGLHGHFEEDPARPVFRRIVSPTRKFTGDNPDALYYEAPVAAPMAYRVRGNMAGAVYVTVTVEAGAGQGNFGDRTAGAISSDQFDVDADGSFEVIAGGPERPRNWIGLADDARSLTTRHYFEEARAVAADPHAPVRLTIEPLDPPTGPPPSPDDETVAAGIRRVANFVRSRTLGMGPPAQRPQPAFVSRTPHQFPPPVTPGDFALSFVDAHYSMAPYLIDLDEAVVMTGRWPECRTGHVVLWNRWSQTYDYAHRTVGLNRAQTQLEPDGTFRIVLAHRDPGTPNWIDTEGRGFGMVFWRFVLAEGEVETPQAEVVKFADLTGGGPAPEAQP